MDKMAIGSSSVHLLHLCCAKFSDSHSHACLHFFFFLLFGTITWCWFLIIFRHAYYPNYWGLAQNLMQGIAMHIFTWNFWPLSSRSCFQWGKTTWSVSGQTGEAWVTCYRVPLHVQCGGGSVDGECGGRTYMSSMWTHTRTMCHIISSRSCNPSHK